MRHVLVIGELWLTRKDVAALGLELTIFQKNALVAPALALLGARLFAFDYDDAPTSVAIARALHDRHPIHGVIAFAEGAAEVAARIRDALGIEHTPSEVEEDAALRELVGMRDAPLLRSRECASLDDARQFVAQVGWPVSLRPCNRSKGDAGASYASSASQLDEVWGKVAGSESSGVLMEQLHAVEFPEARAVRDPGVCAIGTDLRPETRLRAMRSGIFPWPKGDLTLWHSPNPRCIFPLESEPTWSRSLKRTLRKHPYEVTVDQGFMDVVRACGAVRDETWINGDMLASCEQLFREGWAHSVEVWEGTGPERVLVGGIFGIAVGGAFSGESMFHIRTDASKIAFATLAERLFSARFSLFDVQVGSDHLTSLGCVMVSRTEYLDRLEKALGEVRTFPVHPEVARSGSGR